MSYPVFYPEAGDTLPVLFDTFDGGTGASITMTGFILGDIQVYKDGGTTQRASTNGYVLLDTDGIDFDSRTGIHGFSLDLSDDTDSGFYTTGSWFHVVIATITVDAQTVNFVAASFRILSVTRGMAGTALPGAVADAAGGLPISDAGGLDLDAIVNDVWDEILTGGTHNIANSSGRRLRTLQESGGVYGGQIYVDTINGTAGTTNYENGTSDNHVLTIADAKTISASIEIPDFHIINGSSITLAESTVNESYFGDNWSLALGGQAVGGAYFQGASVSGIGTSASDVSFRDCDFGTASVQRGHFDFCNFANTVTFTLAADYNFHNCSSEGDTSPIFTKTAGQAVVVEFHSWSGEITISGVEAGDVYELGGSYRSIVINGADGTVHIHGLYEDVTDNRTGSPVLTVTGAIKAADVDTILSDSNILFRGTIQTAISDSEFTIDSSAASNDDVYNGMACIIIDSADADDKQVGAILNYTGSTQTVTLEGTFSAPSPAAGDTIIIVAQKLSSNSLSANTLTNAAFASGALTATEASVNISQIGSNANAATKLALSADTIVRGTVDDSAFSPTVTQFEADDITEATADHFNGRVIIFTSGALANQAADINDYALVGSNGRFTVSTLTEAPANNVTFVIV